SPMAEISSGFPTAYRVECHSHDGRGGRHREQTPRERAADAYWHGRQGDERDEGGSQGEDRGGRRLDLPDAGDPKRDKCGPDDDERGSTHVDRPEPAARGADLASDEANEDRRREPGVVEMDRGEQRNVLAEVH